MEQPSSILKRKLAKKCTDPKSSSSVNLNWPSGGVQYRSTPIKVTTTSDPDAKASSSNQTSLNDGTASIISEPGPYNATGWTNPAAARQETVSHWNQSDEEVDMDGLVTLDEWVDEDDPVQPEVTVDEWYANSELEREDTILVENHENTESKVDHEQTEVTVDEWHVEEEEKLDNPVVEIAARDSGSVTSDNDNNDAVQQVSADLTVDEWYAEEENTSFDGVQTAEDCSGQAVNKDSSTDVDTWIAEEEQLPKNSGALSYDENLVTMDDLMYSDDPDGVRGHENLCNMVEHGDAGNVDDEEKVLMPFTGVLKSERGKPAQLDVMNEEVASNEGTQEPDFKRMKSTAKENLNSHGQSTDKKLKAEIATPPSKKKIKLEPYVSADQQTCDQATGELFGKTEPNLQPIIPKTERIDSENSNVSNPGTVQSERVQCAEPDCYNNNSDEADASSIEWSQSESSNSETDNAPVQSLEVQSTSEAKEPRYALPKEAVCVSQSDEIGAALKSIRQSMTKTSPVDKSSNSLPKNPAPISSADCQPSTSQGDGSFVTIKRDLRTSENTSEQSQQPHEQTFFIDRSSGEFNPRVKNYTTLSENSSHDYLVTQTTLC